MAEQKQQQESEAPSVAADFLSTVALRLTTEPHPGSSESLSAGIRSGRTEEGSWLGMATLVGPRHAVTPYHVVQSHASERLRVLSTRYSEGESAPDTAGVGARMVVNIPSADLALLELERDASVGTSPTLVSDQSPEPGTAWMCYFVTPSHPLGAIARGAFAGRKTVEGFEHLALAVEVGPSDTKGMSGAPVLGEGRLIGVMARTVGAEWFALPISKSVVEDLLRKREVDRSSVTAAAKDSAPELRPSFFDRLSPSSLMALSHADAMRRFSGQDRIHMEHLVVGLFLKKPGPAEALFRAHGVTSTSALNTVLGRFVDLSISKPVPSQPATVTGLPPSSSHVERAFIEAQAIADNLGSTRIQSRHLLYGMLSIGDCEIVRALQAQGIRREDIPLDEASHDGSVPDDSIPDDIIPVVGANSDTTGGDDLLGLETEIDTLSALVASTDTKTPVSIGLFGEWGGGKSFFMEKMDERIRGYRAQARLDSASPFCPNIVQLRFNAWHYIDRSLWASIGAEIFEGLAHGLAEDRAKVAGRSQLETKRTELLVQKVCAERGVDKAKQEYDASNAELSRIDAHAEAIRALSDRKVEDALGFPAIVKELVDLSAAQPEIRKSVDQAAVILGRSKLADQAAAAEEQLKQLVAIGSFWRGVAASMRSGPRWWIAGLAVAALFYFLAQLLVIRLGQAGAFLDRLAPLVGALIGIAAPFVAAARRVTALARDARARLQERIDAKKEQQLAAVAKEREAIQQKATAREETLGESQRLLNGLQEQLDELQPVRQLTDFIQQRYRSDAYTKHFGVIARARQDFEELSRLMEQVKTQRDETDAIQIPPVDRIVLYIDDLDRCPEKKVFEVLQAVHLLLAFPLFVVVVGVDPRWLLHSLRNELSALRENGNGDHGAGDEEDVRWQSTPLNYLEKIFQIPFTLRPMGKKGFANMIDELTKPASSEKHATNGQPAAGSPASPEGNATRESTPAIANQPEPTQESVSSDVASATAAEPNVDPGSVRSDGSGVAAGASPASPENAAPATTQNAPAAQTPTISRETARRTHARLRLEDWESAYMKKLFRLIPSPRAAKRFVNVYRLLRGMSTGEERKKLIGTSEGGGYRPVLLMLAMITGYPVETAHVLERLLDGVKDGAAPESWWELIEEIEASRTAEPEPDVIEKTLGEPPLTPERESLPTQSGQKARPRPRPAARDDAQAQNPTEFGEIVEESRWDELFDDLSQLRTDLEDEFECLTMAHWAPSVARYSFASGRLVMTAPEPENAETVH